MSILVEACCASVEDVLEAEKAGCDRVELCSAMSLGGLTPTVGTIRAIKAKSKIPIMAMNRPRSGGFCYTDEEFEMMKHDACSLIAEGVEGLVFGILRPDGTVDSERCGEMMRLISHESMKLPKRVQTVFHRAFDVTPDWRAAMEELIEISFDRILTSGQVPNANDGAQNIADMIKAADGRIEVMPGSGVKAETVANLVEKTGAKAVHLRAVSWHDDTSCSHGPAAIPFNGSAEPEDQFAISDASYFQQLISNLK